MESVVLILIPISILYPKAENYYKGTNMSIYKTSREYVLWTIQTWTNNKDTYLWKNQQEVVEVF